MRTIRALQLALPRCVCRPARAVAVGALALSACAANSPSSDDRTIASRSDGARSTSQCITNRGLRDFETLDEQNLVLFGPGNRPYHVVLARRAIGLESEFALGILDRDGRLCPFGGDAIIVEGVLTDRIPIRSIERIDDDDLEALRVQYGKIEPADGEVVVTDIEIDP